MAPKLDASLSSCLSKREWASERAETCCVSPSVSEETIHFTIFGTMSAMYFLNLASGRSWNRAGVITTRSSAILYVLVAVGRTTRSTRRPEAADAVRHRAVPTVGIAVRDTSFPAASRPPTPSPRSSPPPKRRARLLPRGSTATFSSVAFPIFLYCAMPASRVHTHTHTQAPPRAQKWRVCVCVYTPAKRPARATPAPGRALRAALATESPLASPHQEALQRQTVRHTSPRLRPSGRGLLRGRRWPSTTQCVCVNGGRRAPRVGNGRGSPGETRTNHAGVPQAIGGAYLARRQTLEPQNGYKGYRKRCTNLLAHVIRQHLPASGVRAPGFPGPQLVRALSVVSSVHP